MRHPHCSPLLASSLFVANFPVAYPLWAYLFLANRVVAYLPVLFLFIVCFFLACFFVPASLHAAETITKTETITVLAPKSTLFSKEDRANRFFNDDIAPRLNRTIADELTQLVGVSLNGQGGQFQSYAIRGFSRGRIRTQIDGIPIITDRRAGNSASFIAPSLINAGQVIKGPSSVLYGSQALGGVVNLSTEMQDETSLMLSLQSSGDALNATFKQQSLGLTTALAYQKGQNEHASDGTPLNTEYQRTSGVIRYQQQHQGYTTTVSWLPSYGEGIGKSNADFPNQALSHYPDELHSLAQIQINANDGWLAKVFHHYQNWDNATANLLDENHHAYNNDSNSKRSNQAFTQNISDLKTTKTTRYEDLTSYQGHTLGGQLIQSFVLPSSNHLVGMDWLSRKGVSISNHYAIGSLNSELNGEEDNLAFYSKNQWRVGAAQLQFGVRYDWIEQQGASIQRDESQAPAGRMPASIPKQTAAPISATASSMASFNVNSAPISPFLSTSLQRSRIHDTHLSASFFAALPITDTLNARLSLANGFRYPTLSERFFSGSTPRGFVQGQPHLKAEKSVGSQLSLHWQASKNIALHSTAYYYDIDNYIERYRINAPFNNTLAPINSALAPFNSALSSFRSYRNLSKGRIYGVETQVQWQATHNRQHHLRFQQQFGEDAAGQRLADLHRKKLSWATKWHMNDLSFSHTIDYYFSTEQVGESEVPRLSAVVWHAAMGYQLNDDINIDLVINNIGDRNHYASLDEDAPLQPERNIRLSTKWLF